MKFSVWAPAAHKVRVSVDAGLHEMTAGDGGWWHAEAEGVNYAFLLDDDEKRLPDPRSRHQPHGVHEESRVYDHGEFAWTDDASFFGEGFLKTDRREQARRNGADAKSFEEAPTRKAGGFGRIDFVRHGRLSIGTARSQLPTSNSPHLARADFLANVQTI